MERRSKDWNEELSKDLRKSKKARYEFFNALIEEGYSWIDAIKHVARLIGIKEYSEMIDFKPSNLINQLKKESNITLKTAERIAAPIGKIDIILKKVV